MDYDDEQVGVIASALRKLGFGPRRLPVVEEEEAESPHFNATQEKVFLGREATALQSQLAEQAAEIERLQQEAARSFVQRFSDTGRIIPAQVAAATQLYLAAPDAFTAFMGDQPTHPAISGNRLLSAEELADNAAGTTTELLVSAEDAFAHRRQMNLTGGRN